MTIQRPEMTEHAPRITPDRERILGCTCGWRAPTHGANSEDAIAMHVALHARRAHQGIVVNDRYLVK